MRAQLFGVCAVYTLFGAYLRNGLTVTTTVYVAQNRMYFSKERIERGTSESPLRSVASPEN